MKMANVNTIKQSNSIVDCAFVVHESEHEHEHKHDAYHVYTMYTARKHTQCAICALWSSFCYGCSACNLIFMKCDCVLILIMWATISGSRIHSNEKQASTPIEPWFKTHVPHFSLSVLLLQCVQNTCHNRKKKSQQDKHICLAFLFFK